MSSVLTDFMSMSNSCWQLLMGGQETFGELNLGKEYFEGDMVLTEEQRKNIQNIWQDGSPQSKDLALNGFRQLWPNNTVPYTIATRMRKKN